MKPTPVALGLVRLSTRMLPAGAMRQRYRWELFADLSALDRPHQLSYASGVFSTAWRLRRELTQELDPVNDTVATPTVPLTCRLNMHHAWHWESTDDGQRYRRCWHCDKVDIHTGSGPLDWFAAR
jgi:hypothetical protein